MYLGAQKLKHKLEDLEKSIHVSDLATPLGGELLDCYLSVI